MESFLADLKKMNHIEVAIVLNLNPLNVLNQITNLF